MELQPHAPGGACDQRSPCRDYTGDIAECAWADWLYVRAGAGDDLTLDAGATCCCLHLSLTGHERPHGN